MPFESFALDTKVTILGIVCFFEYTLLYVHTKHAELILSLSCFSLSLFVFLF